MPSLAELLAGAGQEIGSGIGNAASGWLDLYNKALSPAMLNEPLGAWRRLATLGASVPMGGLADTLAIGGPAMGKVGMGTDMLRASNALAGYGDKALGRKETNYDPYTGAVIDSEGRRWY